MRRLVAVIRDNDERKVEKAVHQLAGTRKIFAQLALAVGEFVMLFSGLRLLVMIWRLILVEMLPAEWIWAVTVDLKAHALSGRRFHDIRGPVVLVLLAAVVPITIEAFCLNAAFAFAISQPGPPDVRVGVGQGEPARPGGHRLGHMHRPGAGRRHDAGPAAGTGLVRAAARHRLGRHDGVLRRGGRPHRRHADRQAGAAVTGLFGAIIRLPSPE